MDDLIAFINAQLDEDELAHARHHDPLRVLREVAAARAILADRKEARAKFEEFSAGRFGERSELSQWRHRTAGHHRPGRAADHAGRRRWAGRVIEVERIIGVLGVIWSDRPGYRDEWAPGGG